MRADLGEAALRFESAEQIFRTTTREVELHGVTRRTSSTSPGGRRGTSPSASHSTCLGMAFARMEGEAVLAAFTRRARGIDGSPGTAGSVTSWDLRVSSR